MQNHFLARELKGWRFHSCKGSLIDGLVLFRLNQYIHIAFLFTKKTELMFS